MKLITHAKAPKPTTMTLETDPMILWLSKTIELRIERGDTIKEVARAIRKIITPLGWTEAKELAAFYFAIGEATAKRKFGVLNLRSASGRRYRPKQ